MRTKIIILCTFLFLSFNGRAEEYPVALQKYNSSFFIHSFVQKGDINKKNIGEHLEELKNNAIRGVASQIEIKIKDNAELNKQSVNGKTNVVYSNSATFKTDVKLELVKTDYMYDKKSKTLFVVAFIEKIDACNYYKNEISRINIDLDGILKNVAHLIDIGEVSTAKKIIEKDLSDISKVNDWEQRLSIFGCSRQDLIQISSKNNAIRTKIKEMKGLIISSSLVFIKYPIDYNNGDQLLFAAVKASLSNKEFRFTANEAKALWYIDIRPKVSHSNEAYGMFFSYVNAEVNLINQKNALQIYQEVLTQKSGGSSYEKAELEAYKELGKKVGAELYIQMTK